MIICSCNVVTRALVIETAARLAREQPGRPLTPARVYRALGHKAQCAVCFPQVRIILAEIGMTLTCPEPLASEAEDEVI